MNRRSLLRSFFPLLEMPSGSLVEPMGVVGGIEEYTQPLTRTDVGHLLRRIGFSATQAQLNQYTGQTARQIVEVFLGSTTIEQPAAPGSWVNDITEDPRGADLQTRFAIERTWATNMGKLADWWLNLMSADTTGVEKLTLFWEGHFTTEFSFDESVTIPQTLYRKIATLRSDCVGDFQKMVLDITLDNSMLYYLGGYLNEAGKPNENYARELMELFTTGIGWYTEGDVQQAARVLTGWKVSLYNDTPSRNGDYNSFFVANKHDTGAKQFMGQTIPARTADNNTEFQVRNEEVAELIRIIFSFRADAVARFIANKAYRYYVYSSERNEAPEFVAQLAQVFKESNFQIRPMLVTLFCSQYFFDPAIRGCQIKSPVEFVVGLCHQLGIPINDGKTWISRMDQPMSDPPDVSGFPGYRAWISTNTYPVRRQFASTICSNLTDTQVFTLITSIPQYTEVRPFLRGMIEHFLPVDVSQSRFEFYLQTLLQNAPDYEWAEIVRTPAASVPRCKALLLAFAKAPDFQLC
jgi:uncharacterized protein (DUF1800 family)